MLSAEQKTVPSTESGNVFTRYSLLSTQHSVLVVLKQALAATETVGNLKLLSL